MSQQFRRSIFISFAIFIWIFILVNLYLPINAFPASCDLKSLTTPEVKTFADGCGVANKYYSLSDSTTCGCTDCPGGSVKPADNGKSNGGGGNSNGAFNIFRCAQCPAGEIVGSGACVPCSDGKFLGVAPDSATTVCESCPVGQYSLSGSIARSFCERCNAGWTSPVGSVSSTACTQCPGGYSTGGASGSACTACEIGFYSPSPSAGQPYNDGAVSCRKCPPGTDSLSKAVSCTKCSKGTGFPLTTAVNDLRSGCENKCAAGSFSSSEGSVFCTPCSPGTFASSVKQSTCDKCVDGQVQPSAGQSVCTDCPVGYASKSDSPPVPNTLPVYCSPCKVGSVGTSTRASSCTLCNKGTYTKASGSSSCIPSPAGSYAGTDGLRYPTPCSPGTVAATEGASECVACSGGKISTDGKTCTNCFFGTYSLTSTKFKQWCQKCDPGKVSASSASSCTACSAGTVQPSPGRSTCSNCLLGQIAREEGLQYCEDCAPGTAPYENEAGYNNAAGNFVNSCNSCAAGYYSSSFRSKFCQPCSIGLYSEPGTTGAIECRQCPVGMTSVSPFSSCTTCATGTGAKFITINSLDYGCENCKIGYDTSFVAGLCTKCSPGTFKRLQDASLCTKCLVGTYGSSSALSVCESCSDGYVALSNGAVTCVPCPAGTLWTSATEPCKPCAAGSYSATVARITSACTPCAVGYYAPTTGMTMCLQCEPGTYSNSLGSVSCAKVPRGTYQNQPGKTEYIECPVGSFSNVEGSTSCSLCNAGTFQSRAGQTSCSSCETGSYVNTAGASTCKPCPKGTYASVEGSVRCLPCPAGQYSSEINSKKCSLCAAGTAGLGPNPLMTSYASDGVGLTACSACEAGTYQAAEGKPTCIPCAAGSYASSAIACSPCDIGTYQDEQGKSLCKSCAVGTYAPNKGMVYCLPASPGYIVTTAKSSTQTPCSVGQYLTTSGQSNCLDCDKGYFSDATNSLICKRCDPGYVNNEIKKSSCIACDPGTYQSEPARATCLACLGGSFSSPISGFPYTICDSCSPGSYAAFSGMTKCSLCRTGYSVATSGATTCSPCGAGTTTGDDTGRVVCTACDAGSYAKYTGSSTACVACDLGSYKPDRVSAACSKCPTGTFSSAQGQTSCIACASGTYNPSEGQSSCLDCPEGTASNIVKVIDGCPKCLPGTYSDGARRKFCLTCSDTQYQPEYGSTSCLACPNNSIRLKGEANSLSDCTCVFGYYLAGDKCSPCPEGAICPADSNDVVPLKGYWRDSETSLTFFKCPNAACIGGGGCTAGHSGVLCTTCTGTYVRVGKYDCLQCQSTLVLVLIAIAIFSIGLLVIWMLVRSARVTWQTTEIMTTSGVKILISYLQVTSLAFNFPFKWPGALATILSAQGSLGGNMLGSLFSWDCLFGDVGLHSYLLRLGIYLLLPVLVTVGTLVCLELSRILVMIVYFIRGIPQLSDGRKNYISLMNTASLVSLFILHMPVSVAIFEIFPCRQVNEKSFVDVDMSMECFSPPHLFVILCVCLPAMIIYSFGIPIIAFFKLYSNRLSLYSSFDTIIKYSFLYKDYKQDRYYWEIVITSRKFVIAIATVVLGLNTDISVCCCVLAMIAFYLYVHFAVMPYDHMLLNWLEAASMIVSFYTMLWGLLFSGYIDDTASIFVTMVIMLLNLVYILVWTGFFIYDVRWGLHSDAGFKINNSTRELRFDKPLPKPLATNLGEMRCIIREMCENALNQGYIRAGIVPPSVPLTKRGVRVERYAPREAVEKIIPLSTVTRAKLLPVEVKVVTKNFESNTESRRLRRRLLKSEQKIKFDKYKYITVGGGGTMPLVKKDDINDDDDGSQDDVASISTDSGTGAGVRSKTKGKDKDVDDTIVLNSLGTSTMDGEREKGENDPIDDDSVDCTTNQRRKARLALRVAAEKARCEDQERLTAALEVRLREDGIRTISNEAYTIDTDETLESQIQRELLPVLLGSDREYLMFHPTAVGDVVEVKAPVVIGRDDDEGPIDTNDIFNVTALNAPRR